MKLLITLMMLASVLEMAAAQSTVSEKNRPQQCMYCKRADINSGMMTNYMFCPTKKNETCYANGRDFIDPKSFCDDNLIPGYNIDIDEDCKAIEARAGTCNSFVSTQAKYGLKSV